MKYRIICLSNQIWDWKLWTNKRQVMSRLANLGHEVIFVDPPIRFQKLIKQIFNGEWSLNRLLTGVREVTTGFGNNTKLINFSPITLSYSESPNFINLNITRLMSLETLPQRGPLWGHATSLQQDSLKTVLWVYNPSMCEYINKIPHDFLIYDCVDDYPSMANYKRYGLSDQVNKWEEDIVSKSDLIFATTPGLVEKLKPLNPETYFVPNAGNFELFSQADRNRINMPASLSGIKSPIIGFTGTIDDYKVDAGLIVKAAQAYPNFSFVIIGPHGETDKEPDLSKLVSLANIHLLPEIKYEEQVSFYAYFDAFIIPYRLNDYTIKGCFPVKFFDALSAGIPTVVTNLPAYAGYNEVCYIGKDGSEFVEMVSHAVAEDTPEKRSARQKVAADNSWDGKVGKQLNLIDEHLEVSRNRN